MNSVSPINVDVAIIGAGPAGSVAAALLQAQGHSVHVIERQHFPRFSIGESLLPQCMEFLEEADLLGAIQRSAKNHHFKFKNGAAFVKGDKQSAFDFTKKFSEGWGTTFQVTRAQFDHELAKAAEAKGVPISWGHEITGVRLNENGATLTAKTEDNQSYTVESKFLLDASGFGRVLPRLLKLDRPSNFPSRMSVFTHIEDGITGDSFDRDKILITVHEKHPDVWFWLIPFDNGRASIGVVAEETFFEDKPENTNERLQSIIQSEPTLAKLLSNANFDTDARQIKGYACNVSQLADNRYALLGNAGEFLDPVFSSGVTIAMKSASLASKALAKQLRGIAVDWQQEYSAPLQAGVNTFKTFVTAWYDGRFQDVIFAKEQSEEIRAMISSILAGYAWDTENPYVKESERRLNTLVTLCRQQG